MSMRSYQITQTVADRARGMIRVERIGRGSSRHWTSDEFEVALADVLYADGVRVVRQFLLTDGTTRIFIIDVDGDGFPLFEESRRTVTGGEHAVPANSTTTSTWSHPASTRRLAGGLVVGPRQAPQPHGLGPPKLAIGSGQDEAPSAIPARPDLVAPDGPDQQPREPEA